MVYNFLSFAPICLIFEALGRYEWKAHFRPSYGFSKM